MGDQSQGPPNRYLTVVTLLVESPIHTVAAKPLDIRLTREASEDEKRYLASTRTHAKFVLSQAGETSLLLSRFEHKCCHSTVACCLVMHSIDLSMCG